MAISNWEDVGEAVVSTGKRLIAGAARSAGKMVAAADDVKAAAAVGEVGQAVAASARVAGHAAAAATRVAPEVPLRAAGMAAGAGWRYAQKHPSGVLGALALGGGALYGLGSSAIGTARDLNQSIGNPAQGLTNYGVQRAFGTERNVKDRDMNTTGLPYRMGK